MWKAGQEGDPSSRKALLWMTAKGGLGGGTERLGEADRFLAWTKKAGGLKTAATKAFCGAPRDDDYLLRKLFFNSLLGWRVHRCAIPIK
jgi:hypothetical protein